MQVTEVPEELAAIAVGAEMGAVLHTIDPAQVSNDRILDVLTAEYRQLCHHQARVAAVLAELARSPGTAAPGQVVRSATPDRFAPDETRAALSWTRQAADREHDLAEAAVHGMPTVFQAWLAGAVDRPRVWIFAQYLTGLAHEQIEKICQIVLPRAPSLTTGQLAHLLRRMVIAVDPDAAARWYRKGVRERNVTAYPASDGTITVSANGLPADEAEAACARIQHLAAAAKRAGHPGLIGQIRCDLFLGLLDGRFHGMTIDQVIAALIHDYRPSGPADPAHSAEERARRRGVPAARVVAALRPVARTSAPGVRAARMSAPLVTAPLVTAPPVTVAVATVAPVLTGRMTAARMATSPALTARTTAAPVAATLTATDQMTTAVFPAGRMAAALVATAQTITALISVGRTTTALVATARMTAALVPAVQMATGRMTACRVLTTRMAVALVPAVQMATRQMTTARVSAGRMTAGPDTATQMATGQVSMALVATAQTAAGLVSAGRVTAGRMITGQTTTALVPVGRVTAAWVAAAQIPAGPVVFGLARPLPIQRAARPINGSGSKSAIGLATLLGLDEHPAEIPGLGLLIAPDARLCVARQGRSEWRFAVTDTDGTLMSEGRTRRRPADINRDGPRGGPPGGIVELHVPATLLHQLSADPSLCGGWAEVIADIAAQHANRERHLADLDAHPGARLPGAALRRHTEIRDRTCTFAGVCRRPARAGDMDHSHDHAHGGTTERINLGQLCDHDHDVKHRAGWTVTQPEPGTFVWHSPLGGTYVARGEFLLPELPDPSPADPGPWPDRTPRTVEGPILLRPPPPEPDPPPAPPPREYPDEPPF